MKHIVFNNMHIINKMHDLRLTATRTMDQTMYFRTEGLKHLFYDRSIGTGRRENKFTGINIQVPKIREGNRREVSITPGLATQTDMEMLGTIGEVKKYLRPYWKCFQ